jgi:hypothetical protein
MRGFSLIEDDRISGRVAENRQLFVASLSGSFRRKVFPD